MDRRTMLRRAAALTAAGAGGGLLAACTGGQEEPAAALPPLPQPAEEETYGPRSVRLGITAQSDAAPVVMAQELGYFGERDLQVRIEKLASAQAIRDALVGGQLDAAHGQYSIPLALAAGIGGLSARSVKIAMVLSANGQAITLNQDFSAVGYGDLAAVRELLEGNALTLAMTFPGGTHDTWLRYWLKASGADIGRFNIISTAADQMVENMRFGNLSGYSVDEPWNTLAVQEGFGFTHLTSQDIWRNHPEKALLVTERFAQDRGDILREVMGAVLQACRWLDDAENRNQAAEVMSEQQYVDLFAPTIRGRLLGRYDLGGGQLPRRYENGAGRVQFHLNGEVNAPRRSHAVWFLTQYQRFGLLTQEPPYLEIADDLLLRDAYAEVAAAASVAVPADDMTPFEVQLDGATFDPAAPGAERVRP